MRYLVIRINDDGSKNKLARFAYNCDAQDFATKVSNEPHAHCVEVLDTKLKFTCSMSTKGVCTFFKGHSMYRPNND